MQGKKYQNLADKTWEAHQIPLWEEFDGICRKPSQYKNNGNNRLIPKQLLRLNVDEGGAGFKRKRN